jgi:hypothetical protein
MSVKITNTKERWVGTDNYDLQHIAITVGICDNVPQSITVTREELNTIANLYLFGKLVEMPTVE